MNNATQLKAKIRNLSKNHGVPAQAILQSFMIERILERISQSPYHTNIVLKGGVLIASMLGIANRTTMDLDVTTIGIKLNKKDIKDTLLNILSINLKDDIVFKINNIKNIREKASTGGIRAHIIAQFDTIKVPLKIDFTTGDSITPDAVQHHIKSIFGQTSIIVLSYNIETILAEKVETIFERGTLNTRPRDFYDVFMISKLKFSKSIFRQAFAATCSTRGSDHILSNPTARITEISQSNSLQTNWKKYQREFSYAKGIDYQEIISALSILIS